MSSLSSLIKRRLGEKKRAGKSKAAEALQEQGQEANERDCEQGHDDKFGLFLLNLQSVDGAECTQVYYQVDIIAVHGLDGDAFKTWTHENGKLWLRDFLPTQLPGARIFSYGYDSAWVFSRGTTTIRDNARDLLEHVRRVRSRDESRAIIFVCHSMGGIVVKQALLIANNEARMFPNILESVSAILFLGTPHRGSIIANYASIISQIVNMFLVGSQVSRITGSMRRDILDSLKENENGLQLIAEDFRVHTNTIKITSFIEKKIMQGFNRPIVDDQSGSIGLANERIVPMPNYDHMEICKFGREVDNGFQNALAAIKDAAASSQTSMLDSVDQACLAALFLTEPKDDYDEVLQTRGKRIEHTCEWIRDCQSYINWFQVHESRLLWLLGSPGMGKTMIATSLVDELLSTQRRSSEIIVGYYFCDDKDENRKTALAILRSLLLQILRQRPQLFKYVRPYFKVQGAKLFTNSVHSLWRIFRDILADPSSHSLYCIIDALDECEVQSRRTFLGHLWDLFASSLRVDPHGTSKGIHVKILITSRHFNDFEEQRFRLYSNTEILNIDSKNVGKDLESFIDIRTEQLLANDYSLSRLSRVKENLKGRAEGSFLWVALVLDELSRSPRTLSDTTLLRIPNRLNDMYDRIIQQIDPRSRTFVENILMWVMTAVRPLTVRELATAAAVSRESKSYTIPDEGALLEFRADLKQCHSLLLIRDGVETVHFIHQSAKDFLLEHFLEPGRIFQTERANYEVFLSCSRYLSIEKFTDSIDPLGGFVEYACVNWAEHARNSAEQVAIRKEWILDFFFLDSAKREMAFDISWRKDHPDSKSIKQMTMLHICSRYGLVNILLVLEQRNLLKGGVGDLDSTGQAPLHHAAYSGHLDSVKFLLKKGANVNARHTVGTALHSAVNGGHGTIVEHLLDNGADIEALSEYEGTPLVTACFVRQEAIARLLIRRGANIEARNQIEDWSILQDAAWAGHEEIVRLALESGANINIRGGMGRMTALHLAAERGQVAMLQLLLKHGADVGIRAMFGSRWAALHSATFYGQEEAVRLLLEAGADPNAREGNSSEDDNSEGDDCKDDKDQYQFTPLHRAAAKGLSSVVKTLLENGADVAARIKDGMTPLHFAAHSGHHEVVRLLLDGGADIEEKANSGWTALNYAISKGSQATCRLLLERGAKVISKTEHGWTVLDDALYNGNISILQDLWDSGPREITEKDLPSQLPGDKPSWSDVTRSLKQKTIDDKTFNPASLELSEKTVCLLRAIVESDSSDGWYTLPGPASCWPDDYDYSKNGWEIPAGNSTCAKAILQKNLPREIVSWGCSIQSQSASGVSVTKLKMDEFDGTGKVRA